CKKEAVAFRDNLHIIADANAVVYGISKDSLVSHERFSDKHELNFVLLSDPDLAVHKRYGTYGEKLVYGKPRVGVIRSTFIIDEAGILVKSWRGVRVNGHIDDVLAALKKLDEEVKAAAAAESSDDS
ncbi:MAG TPA: peroxiredoxin, partial [Sorangium sp.]|nr:peroxiredoxin [Sorangium sp.]